MHFNETSIPDELIRASKSGRLVVFAGAGVSMQKPIELPSFDKLIDQIKAMTASGHRLRARECDTSLASEEKRYIEPPEKYLSYLEGKGCKIRSACAALLNTSGRTTDLHRALIRLFTKAGLVRIVTTNFDLCFENAFNDLEISCRIFAAPALPLGDETTGLVHLHGVIEDEPNMVLTAGDYGKAYVTDGWASRYLVKLFSEYHVLFIGYSCGDSLVDYLTRSISEEMQGKAYVLVARGEDSREWQERGVEAITYPKYEDLPTIITEWVSYLDKNLTDRALELEAIAQNEYIDEKNKEILLDALREPDEADRFVLVRGFCDISNSFAHLEMLAEENLAGFFGAEAPNSVEWILLRWALSKFAVSESRKLQELCYSMRTQLTSHFYHELVSVLAFSDAPSEVVGSWISWIELARLSSSQLNVYGLMEIAKKTINPEIAFAVARILLRADYELRIGYILGQESRTTLSIRYDDELNRLLEALEDHIDEIRDRLADYCIQQIELGYSIQTNCWTQSSGFDSISFSRSAVDADEQDRHDDSAEGFLLNVARECVCERNADAIMRSCFRSRCNLVVRLGLWIRARQDKRGESLDFIINEDYLSNASLHHEVFQLIKTAYSKASKKRKNDFERYLRELWDEEDRASSYNCFNTCNWILGFMEDAQIRLLREEVLRYWPDFIPREHPDYTHFMTSGFVDTDQECDISEECFTIELLIERINANDASRSLLTAHDLVRVPTKKYPQKALALLDELSNRERTEAQISLCNMVLSSIEWSEVRVSRTKVFEILRSYIEDPLTCISALESLFKSISSGDRSVFWSSGHLQKILLAFVPNIFMLEKEESAIIPQEDSDWALVSINHPAGKYIELAVYLTRRLVKAKKAYTEVLRTLFIPLIPLIEPDSQTARCLIVGMMMKFSFFVEHLPKIAEDVLVPLLFSENGESVIAWDGLAFSSTMSKKTWKLIGARWKDAFLDDRLRGIRNRDLLCRAYISCVLAFVPSHKKADYLFACMGSSIESCRTSLARIDYWLGQVSQDDRDAAWSDWLNKAISEVLNYREEYRGVIAEIYARWLRKYPKMRSCIIDALPSNSSHKFNKDIFVHDGTLESIAGDVGLSESHKAKALTFLLNGQGYFFKEDEARQVAGLIDISSLEKQEKSDLEDAYTRKGMAGIFRRDNSE